MHRGVCSKYLISPIATWPRKHREQLTFYWQVCRPLLSSHPPRVRIKRWALILRHCFYWRRHQSPSDSLGQGAELPDTATGLVFFSVLTLIFLLLARRSPKCPTDPLPELVITPGAGNEKGISPLPSGNDRLRDISRPCMKANLSGELKISKPWFLQFFHFWVNSGHAHYHWRMQKLWIWHISRTLLYHKDRSKCPYLKPRHTKSIISKTTWHPFSE